MNSRKDIIYKIVSDTQVIIEKKLPIELNNYLMYDIDKLLDKEYLNENNSFKDNLFCAGCWGGGVWDLMCHNYDIYKPFLVENYEDIEKNSHLSPIYTDFPYEELNNLCISGLKKIKSLE